MDPSYQNTSHGHDSPAPALEQPIIGTFPTPPNAHSPVTDREIRALAAAIDRYVIWHENRIRLREELKFKRRPLRKPNTPEAA